MPGNLVRIIEIAKERDVYVIGIIFPQNPRYKETGAFGRYGLRRSMAPSLIARIKELESLYPNFTMMDENKMGDHDYTDEEAVDTDHLCANSIPKITERVFSVLKNLKR